VQTHSPVAVLQAIAQSTLKTYNSWQGDFISTFLSRSTHDTGIKLYFLANCTSFAPVSFRGESAQERYRALDQRFPHRFFWIVYPAAWCWCSSSCPHRP
jgi:hypothetical protein